EEWILTRTGIRERRIAEPGETMSDLSVAAAREAMARAGILPQDLDLIIVATSSPDYVIPPVSSIIQHKLNARCGAFTLGAGCTGFVYGLAVAHAFIAAGLMRNILVIGAEILSRNIDWTDRNTAVLFGDGAGAMVLQASELPTGLLSFVLGSDGSGAEHLIVPGISTNAIITEETIRQKGHLLRMNGREVFKFATRVLGKVAIEAIARSGLAPDEIDLMIPHQANERIIEAACRELGFPMEKVFLNLDRYGNTSAASIPIAFAEAMAQGRIREGDNLLLIGFGAGLTWAGAVVRYGVRPEDRPIPVENWPVQLPVSLPDLNRLEPVRQAKVMALRARRQILQTAMSLLLPFYARARRRR
uniref:beta-ketoacyl-ACP synthase III n=1 Tax=Thermoflexus sp. TaxID=1969742 RepID=UPI0035E3FDA3